MPHHSVAHLNGLVAAIDTNMHVQAEAHNAAGDKLHGVHQPLVPIVWSEFLLVPAGERVGARPEEGRIGLGRLGIAPFEFFGEINTDVFHGVAYISIEFKIALHKLWLDAVVPFLRNIFKYSRDVPQVFGGVPDVSGGVPDVSRAIPEIF